jgi:hypothetical protein
MTTYSPAVGCAVTLWNARRVEWDGVRSGPLFLVEGRLTDTAAPGARERDLAGHLVFPGLVNAHDHLPRNAIPPLPQREPFPNSYAWIDAFQPFRSDPAVVAACALPSDTLHWHGGLKNLLSGVTTVAHHDPWRPILEDPAFPVRVMREFGWSHSLGLGLDDTRRSSLRYGPEVQVSATSTPSERPWIIHLAEGIDEIAAAELEELDGMGCLTANTLLVHGVGMGPQDVERLLARGAGVIWCPGSNLMLLGRTLMPRRLLDAGKLALGSDSRLAGSFDLLEDLRLAARHSDATPAELLRLVTEAGSRLLRLPDVGGLSVGQSADLLLVQDTGQDPHAALLALRRADIRAVVRNGMPAIADHDFADWFAACAIETVPVLLDGRPKLCARTLLDPPGITQLEPGLEER